MTATLSPTDPIMPMDTEPVDLTRLLRRMREELLQPDSEAERRLRNSIFERNKLHNNISFAQNVLLQLEKDALTITAHSGRQDTQAELVEKHNLLQELRDKLQEWDELDRPPADEDYSSEEDVLGEDTPSASNDEDTSSPDALTPQEPSPTTSTMPIDSVHITPASAMSDYDQLFPSALRSRHARNPSPKADSAIATGSSSVQPTGTTSITEALLTDHRTEQEALTESLVSIAQQLRESTLTFSSALESEKDILENATTGLDKNVGGMESTQKKMGVLRQMTEGKGFLGRLKLYALIFGLMIIAILIVGVAPKLRF